MPTAGWKALIPTKPLFLGRGKFPIPAYSEFMPPPRLGWKPYGAIDQTLFSEDDPWGWRVGEYEEARELQPGLQQVAKQLLETLDHVLQGKPAQGLTQQDLTDNPYWPEELAQHVADLKHEACVIIAPLALSKTQDDKGRIRWTLFGGSERGPAKAFWKSFHQAPDQEYPAQEAITFLCRLLHEVYGAALHSELDLHRAGFRILPQEPNPPLPYCAEGELPRWTRPFFLAESSDIGEVKYLLTFRSFGELPAGIRQAYLQGRLHLIPYPGSLAFWGVQDCHRLRQQLPLAMQIPLLQAVDRHESPLGLRVPQAGWLHEATPGHEHKHHRRIRNTYRRTHRWERILRDQEDAALMRAEEPLVHVLFSNLPDDVGLYGKPMARNVQIWREDGSLLLDGPQANFKQIEQARQTVQKGGLFGYRFQFPPMRVDEHEVYWHRPLIAYRHPRSGEAKVVAHAPLGYLTAYDSKKPNLDKPIELWPRLQHRELALATLPLFSQGAREHGTQEARNIRKLLESAGLWGGKLPRSFARQLARLPKHQSFDQWLESLQGPLTQVRQLIDNDQSVKTAKGKNNSPPSWTYQKTARREFELAYWQTIVDLAEGAFLNKNVADCVRDDITQSRLTYPGRHLDALADYLLKLHHQNIKKAKMQGRAVAGELPFRWQPEFPFYWSQAWQRNRKAACERDLLVVIPGRDRKRAVIMADHFDTAYMEDCYDGRVGKPGARLAACGADDNHSATAALLLAAPIFLQLSKAGKLGCDVWLIHLTGEEFPTDCLGARHLTQWIVERSLELQLGKGRSKKLANVEIKGLYVLDMVAHNNDREQDIFQIAPGTGKPSLWLAYQAHMANRIWNESTEIWNKQLERKGRPRGRRSPHGAAVPEVALHLPLSGEVRPTYDPRSALFNTDGQIFSDAGVPAVLFMENYDINRQGYHDTHDTMANIDLDYGAALTAIAIETVARAAIEENI
jgi:hypothetical protein